MAICIYFPPELDSNGMRLFINRLYFLLDLDYLFTNVLKKKVLNFSVFLFMSIILELWTAFFLLYFHWSWNDNIFASIKIIKFRTEVFIWSLIIVFVVKNIINFQISMQCAASGDRPPQFVWERDGIVVSSTTDPR